MPVCLDISKELSILHCTSDILDIAEKESLIEISLYGDRDLTGEIVLEGSGIRKIKSATIDGEPVAKAQKGNRVIYTYLHKHRKEIILSVTRTI